MSVIKIGNRIVQSGDSGYQPEGVKTFTPQRRQLKTASEIPDNRERFIANQAQKAANQQAQFLINQANRRSDVETAMRFAPETVNRSDFTGYTGGPFGLRISKDQDTGIPKLREGLTSDQYANYMRGLYSINPQRMETMFPFASGATIRNLSRFAPGLGTLQSIAGFVGGKTGDVVQGLKQIAINKGILPPTTLNPNTGTTIDPTKVQNVSELDPSTKALIAPDVYGGRSPMDEAFASLPSTQFGREYMQRFGPRQDFRQPNTAGMLKTDPNMFTNPATGNPLIFAPSQSEVSQLRGNIPGIGSTTKMTRNMMEQLDPFTNPDVPFVPMNEGGLASINNPEYTMLRRASDFDI